MDLYLREHQKASFAYEIPGKNIPMLFCDRAKIYPNQLFAIFPGEKDKQETYKSILNSILIRQQVLKELGLKKGDALSILLPNSSEFITLYFSALGLGVILVPINPELNSLEIEYIVKNSGSKALIYEDSLKQKVDGFATKAAESVILYSVAHLKALDVKANGILEDDYLEAIQHIQPYDTAVIIYTSGTTGKPKGVILTHMNLLADAKAIHDWFHFSHKTRTLCILPLFHNNGQVVTLLAPLVGGGSTVVVQAASGLSSIWALIRKYQITFTSLMSSILAILISMPNERTDSTLEGIVCGGQVLLPSVQEAFERRFNVPIYEGFGLTETTSFACFNNYPSEKRKNGSIGKALPCNSIELMADSGKFIDKPFEIGQIVIRGYNVCTEYLNLPHINALKFVDGWFYSGDYGYKDEDGYLYFKGRKDFLIIKGGENIYPSEIENALYLHPDISDVAVIGVDSILLGQEIVAFVKLSIDSLISDVDLLEHCKRHIAKYKIPKKIYILCADLGLEDIPRGPTKKTLYNELHKFYVEKIKNAEFK